MIYFVSPNISRILSFQHAISIKNCYRHFMLVFILSLQKTYVFCIYRTFQCRLATFQVLSRPCGYQLPYCKTYSQSSFLKYSLQREVQQDSHSLKVSPHNRVISYKGQNTNFTVWQSGRHPFSQRSKLALPVVGLMNSRCLLTGQ